MIVHTVVVDANHFTARKESFESFQFIRWLNYSFCNLRITYREMDKSLFLIHSMKVLKKFQLEITILRVLRKLLKIYWIQENWKVKKFIDWNYQNAESFKTEDSPWSRSFSLMRINRNLKKHTIDFIQQVHN